ncbi:DUF7793 family protein [Pontibacter rugosus]|uniref:DUF7793 domain-containing protein n=1 Tax=Pontibacter rugosus TaxID=1745966 RepID=A0ABW3SPA2_9BACT
MVNSESDRDIKSTETAYVKMMLKNGIFYMYYKPLKQLELTVAKQIVNDRIAFVEGESYPCLFDIQPVEHSTKEARDYMADEGNDFVISSAILVGSPVLRMMANFFIMVNKPKNPTRMFSDEKSALEWLVQFKQ